MIFHLTFDRRNIARLCGSGSCFIYLRVCCICGSTEVISQRIGPAVL